MSDDGAARLSPLNDTGSNRKPEVGIGLCLSGGGYRAMLFHVGSLWRLYEAGILAKLARISSVSGGSISAGALALAWPKLSFDPARLNDDWLPLFVAPVRALAGRTIDAYAVLGGVFLPGTIADHVAGHYREYLFGEATLQDLPNTPRFAINATNVQTGVLWRFSKPYMGDYRVGRVLNPTLSLAVAVAASSAFPPILSPMTIEIDPTQVQFDPGSDLHMDPYNRRVVLCDGGVYDNLGLETVWKRYDSVLISDAGAHIEPEPEPYADWARHSYRILNIVDSQVRALRKRETMEAYRAGLRKGAYWGIGTDIAAYGAAAMSQYPYARTLQLAKIATRLARLEPDTQDRLINWGYAVCDAALRAYVDRDLPRPKQLPYAVNGL